MSKRRITLSLDEDVVDALRSVGGDNVSAVANEALRTALERQAHQTAVLDWLHAQYAEHGPPTGDDYAAADTLLAQFDGTVESTGEVA